MGSIHSLFTEWDKRPAHVTVDNYAATNEGKAPPWRPRIETGGSSETFLKKLIAVGAAKAIDDQLEGSLTNELHPIFRKENWDAIEVTGQEWENMTLAFQLASCFLDARTYAIDYFVRLTHAQPLRYHTEPNRFYLNDHVGISPHMIIATKQILEQMAQVIRFSGEKRETMDNGETGITQVKIIDEYPLLAIRAIELPQAPPINQIQTSLHHDQFPIDHYVSIQICEALIEAIQTSVIDHDAPRLRRASFQLAITLVHEICHAVWMFVRGTEYRDIICGEEPCVYPTRKAKHAVGTKEPELGNQWEEWMLGFYPWATGDFAKKLPIQSVADTDNSIDYGRVVAACLPHVPVLRDDSVNGAYELVSQDYIDQFFLEDTWEQIRLEGRKKFPAVPKACGTCAVVRQPGSSVWHVTNPKGQAPQHGTIESPEPSPTSLSSMSSDGSRDTSVSCWSGSKPMDEINLHVIRRQKLSKQNTSQ